MAKLYELAAEHRAMVDKLMDTELPAEVIMDTIEAESGDLKDKLRAIAAVIDEMNGLASIAADRSKRMMDRAKSLELQAERLSSYAMVCIQNSKLQLPVECGDIRINLRKSPPSVDVFDATKLPAKFMPMTISMKVRLDTSEQRIDITELLQNALTQAGYSAPDIAIEAKPDKPSIRDALKSGEKVEGARWSPTSYSLDIR